MFDALSWRLVSISSHETYVSCWIIISWLGTTITEKEVYVGSKTNMLLFAMLFLQVLPMNKLRTYKTTLLAHLEKFKAWSYHAAFERTPLAPSKIPHSIHAHDACFPSLQQHSSTIPVFFSQHISTITLPLYFDRTTTQNSKNKLENLR